MKKVILCLLILSSLLVGCQKKPQPVVVPNDNINQHHPDPHHPDPHHSDDHHH